MYSYVLFFISLLSHVYTCQSLTHGLYVLIEKDIGVHIDHELNFDKYIHEKVS
jgi:hypothetical protein